MYSPQEQVVQLGKLISVHAYRRSLVSRNHEYTNASKEGSLNTKSISFIPSILNIEGICDEQALRLSVTRFGN